MCQLKSRRQRNSNPQSSDSKSDALSVGPCGHMSCQLYLLLVQLPSVVPCNKSISKKFFCVKQKVGDSEIRTPNLLIRSQTPYPLDHPAKYPVNCMLLIQLPSVVPCVDSISKKFPLCQAKSRPQRDSNPQSSDSKSHALFVGLCGHVYCQLYLLLVQLPSIVPCNDSISKNFPLCQTKSRPQRDSYPQSSDSKSDAFSVGPCGHVYCQFYLLLVQLPSVVSCNDSISKNFPLCQTKSRP